VYANSLVHCRHQVCYGLVSFLCQHSPSSPEVKNEWGYTSTPHDAFMAWTATTLPFSTSIAIIHALSQRRTNPGSQFDGATKFWLVAPNICGSSVCNLLHVALLVLKIFRWIIRFLENLYYLPDNTLFSSEQRSSVVLVYYTTPTKTPLRLVRCMSEVCYWFAVLH
jgi:hypothetical protein